MQAGIAPLDTGRNWFNRTPGLIPNTAGTTPINLVLNDIRSSVATTGGLVTTAGALFDTNFTQGGTPVKFEADNCFAMFPTVDDAIECALSLNTAFDKANEGTPDELDIRVAIGIDFGRILLVDGSDFFGHPVNRASKLGEDLARPGEVLVTIEAAARSRSLDAFALVPHTFQASGLDIEAYAVSRKG